MDDNLFDQKPRNATVQRGHAARRSTAWALGAAALAAVLVAGCGRDDGRTAGQRLDAAVASTEAKTASVAKTAEAKLDRATDRVAAAVEDAKITAAVNAKLAEDASLSALRINVDTAVGKVSLTGTAPDDAARERATQLAQSLPGVKSVSNLLEVRS